MLGEVLPVAAEALEQQGCYFLPDLFELLGDGIMTELEQGSVAEVVKACKYQLLELLLLYILDCMDGSPEVHGVVGNEKGVGVVDSLRAFFSCSRPLSWVIAPW